MNPLVTQFFESALVVIGCYSLSNRWWAVLERLAEFRRHRYGFSLLVVNSYPSQVLPVAEALHQSLQSPVRAKFPGALDIVGKALTEHLGSPLQFTAQAAFLAYDLVVREAERNQGDADDQGNDEQDTQQSHG